MIRSAALLLVVAAFLALSGPAGASITHPPPIPPPSDYEAVDTATRIFFARVISVEGEKARFEVEEVLKGEPAKTLQLQPKFLPPGDTGYWNQWCTMDIKGCYREDALYLLLLRQSEDDGSWVNSAIGQKELEPDDPWMETVRLFAGISALDDAEKEREALQQLRKAAAEDSKGDGKGRYPAGLVRRIDRHFALPSPKKPFSELRDLYYAAEMDAERLEVLWAMVGGQHPETPSFFRGMLFAGEPDRLLAPVLALFQDHPEELPRTADLARLYLAAAPGERNSLLQLILMGARTGANEKDDPLLWSLLPGSNQSEIKVLAGGVLGRHHPAPRLELLAVPDDRVRTRLLFYRMSGLPALPAATKYRLDALLQPGVRNPKASVGKLAGAFKASADPQERLRILMDLVLRAGPADLPVVWDLLGHAKGGEADLLLGWFAANPPAFPVRVSLYRNARTEEERNRALWVAAATTDDAFGFRFMELLRDVGLSTADNSHPVERPMEPLVRAFVTCPNEDAQSLILVQITYLANTAESMPAMLEILRAAAPRHAYALMSWFATHPSPEALPHLRRLAGSSPEQDFATLALAAAGDPEVVEHALRVLSRPGRDDDPWARLTLARSPLPAAAEALRRLSEKP